MISNPLAYLAGSKGLEPSASGVTGRIRYFTVIYRIVFFTYVNSTY